ncbi:MOSC N-terminal beta barrel domain-containing protein [uncultured Roseovarius sp.]|uniref:MOSC domain-containing protein n=1 Tax=uncultured Roseovarius sp. TaxID=293344 RepID=UPI0025E4F708|nr:MOSC N-terminal beta barrel domain-containing protein [uncultured Roseovarius sp.]
MATVSAIWRHPIKSHGREALTTVTLTKGQAMPWDRRWGVAHEAARLTDGTWGPCVNFSRGSKTAALMAINATCDEATGVVTLSHPDRPDLAFDPDQEQDRFLTWVRPLVDADRAQPARLFKLEGRGVTDTDYPSVSLLNLASNADLADKMGATDISALRWRCNLHLDGLEPWQEFDWIGKTLRIGTAELTVREPIKRCLATTANPKTGLRDLDTLAALNAHWDHQNFGIYAEVTTTGRITVGDSLQVL